ncbi:hypothetical protein L3X38_021279 [Prunus dulcis]|uniref:DUF3700 domain-containing protein n=1 Tax=Prunus dulcis TaxID=3755 RepID=A0AAD4VV17_PRUDU|nr:hypothetical protein L3X38_021279 [Prunus dulcis]
MFLQTTPTPIQQRLFCSLDNIYCIFLGSLNNLCSLNKAVRAIQMHPMRPSRLEPYLLHWVPMKSCAKSFAPFPAGCMFHSEQGLMSFEHPTRKMKAMPRIDSEGVMCGANFKCEANWATWGPSSPA